jgi:hypothetical protein
MYALGGERSDEDRPQGVVLLPTPDTGNSPNGQDQVSLLGTPTARIHKGGSSRQRKSGADKARLEDQVSLLPTPRTSDTNGAGAHGTGGPDLRTVASLLPTPSVADAMGGHMNRSGARSGELLLPGVARSLAQTSSLAAGAPVNLLPTPRATDGTKGGPNQRGSSGDLMLPSAVMLLPTPVAHDSHNSPETHLRKKPGRTQVTSLQIIVENELLSTGGRIAPPSNAGSESSGE